MIRVPKVPGAETGAGEGGESGRSLWLISFTDLISLMLAFFVLMYAMAEPEGTRIGAVPPAPSARSLTDTVTTFTPMPTAPYNAEAVEVAGAMNLDYLGTLLAGQVGRTPDLAGVSVRREDDRVVIILPAEVLFAPAGTAFSERGRRALFLLGAVVGRIGNRIEVVGHAEREADPLGVGWERALGRAAAVAMALRETGYGHDLVARSVAVPPGRGGGGPRVDLVVRDQAGE